MNVARKAILDEVFTRAAGRRVFGYDSETGKGGELVNGGTTLIEGDRRVGAKKIDRVCIEGERGRQWQTLPSE